MQHVTVTDASSLGNLNQAISEFDEVSVFDNSQAENPPVLVLEAIHGNIVALDGNPPAWLVQSLPALQGEGALSRLSPLFYPKR